MIRGGGAEDDGVGDAGSLLKRARVWGTGKRCHRSCCGDVDFAVTDLFQFLRLGYLWGCHG